jgi:hypothetical protein
MFSKKRTTEKPRCQSDGGRRRCVVPKDCKRRHEAINPRNQGLTSWPFDYKFQDALFKTGECLGKCSSEIVQRGRDDIQTCRRASAPLSKYSEVWTFPVFLIAYSTMVIAWASELAGALLVWIIKVSELRASHAVGPLGSGNNAHVSFDALKYNPGNTISE